MITRTALAAPVALSATLVSGTFALGATTGFSAGEANVAAAASAGPAAPSTTGIGDSPPDPMAEFFAAVSANQGPAERGSTPSTAAAWWGAAVSKGAATPSPASGPSPTTTTPPSPPPPPPPPPTTSTTGPPPFNCRGSDDGLDEATKRAREAYCHGEDEDA